MCVLRPAFTDDFNIWILCGWRYGSRVCCSVYPVLFKIAIMHVSGVYVYLACYDKCVCLPALVCLRRCAFMCGEVKH